MTRNEHWGTSSSGYAKHTYRPASGKRAKLKQPIPCRIVIPHQDCSQHQLRPLEMYGLRTSSSVRRQLVACLRCHVLQEVHVLVRVESCHLLAGGSPSSLRGCEVSRCVLHFQVHVLEQTSCPACRRQTQARASCACAVASWDVRGHRCTPRRRLDRVNTGTVHLTAKITIIVVRDPSARHAESG